jgi:diadenosine tetraphosphate (Ap4A) HIT family hydrolase
MHAFNRGVAMAVVVDGKCPFCPVSQTVYLESARWVLLRHLDPVPIAGWMMIATREHRSGLAALSPEEAAEVGPILSAIAESVRAVTGAERTYGITFNEAVRHLHLHVIPRHADDASTTSWALADRYRATARREIAPAGSGEAESAARAVAEHALARLRSLGFSPPATS